MWQQQPVVYCYPTLCASESYWNSSGNRFHFTVHFLLCVMPLQRQNAQYFGQKRHGVFKDVKAPKRYLFVRLGIYDFETQALEEKADVRVLATRLQSQSLADIISLQPQFGWSDNFPCRRHFFADGFILFCLAQDFGDNKKVASRVESTLKGMQLWQIEKGVKMLPTISESHAGTSSH